MAFEGIRSSISFFRFSLAFIALLWCGGHGFCYGGLGMGGVIVPHPRAASKNPAYTAYPERPGFETGYQIPLGLLGLLPASRNPLLYAIDREAFLSNFDFLTFFDQASNPQSILINPAASIEEVVFSVTKEQITVTDETGDPLIFRDVTGPRGISVGGTPLIPPPLFAVPARIGEWYFHTGIFAGGGGYSLSPNENLDESLKGQNINPEARYSVHGSGSIQTGISQSVTFSPRLASPPFCDDLYVGLRLLVFYMAGYTEFDVSAETQTNAERIPESTDYNWELFYLYPGSGGGYGARFDAGIALDIDTLTVGLGVLNIVGFSHLLGRDMYYTDEGTLADKPASRLFYEFQPAVFFNLSYLLAADPFDILLAADIGYTKSAVVHGGVGLYMKRFFFRCGLGWEGHMRFGAGWGVFIGRHRYEIAVTSHEAPFVGGRVYGLAFNIGSVSR